ncbi:MAG TPA: MBL fold metallo-hydrolase [Candidatus Saccharimonadales bacterium]|nr:MBL fold metallo-hydrolase [Candidatus Saccharimonadales bacterium]
MKLTKYEHACIVLEEQGQKLIIDPGSFTENFGDVYNVAAVVVTHEHFDHLNSDHLKMIIEANPGVNIYTPSDAAHKLKDLPGVTPVTGGDIASAGPFKLQFYGERHAKIHPTFSAPENVGVMVNERFYYPGDSFVAPGVPVEFLAVPTSGPWLKIGEVIDFVDTVKPKKAIPTHNALLSEVANGMTEDWLAATLQKYNTEYRHLNPSESLEF